jgi:hypothetical protein
MEFRDTVQSLKNHREAILVGGLGSLAVAVIAVGGAIGVNNSISQEGNTALYQEEIPHKVSNSSGEVVVNLRQFPVDNDTFQRFMDRLTEQVN